MPITRRALIQKALNGTGLYWISSIFPLDRLFANNSEMVFDCIVLGAGVSGLAAARALTNPALLGPYKKTGYNPTPKKVLVIEGSDRIGGRVQTNSTFFPGLHLELGAENIHTNPGMSPLWDEIARFQLKLVHFNSAKMGLIYNSHLLPNLQNLFHAGANSGVSPNVFNNPTDEDLKGSVDDFHKKISKNHRLSYEIARAFFNNSGPLDQNSFAGFIADRFPEMMQYKYESKIVSGNSSLINHLAENLLILKNSKVDSIDYGQNGVTITCTNGNIYRAKTAICTFSIGMLQNGKIKFNPSLSDKRLMALDAVGIGNTMKVMMKFKRRFWPDNINLLVNTDSNRQAGRFYFQVHRLTLNEPSNANDKQPPVLNALVADEDADRFINSNTPDDEIVKKICMDLDQMFKEKLNGQKAIALLEKNPDGSLRYLLKNWPKDAFAMGANTFIKQNRGPIAAEKVRPQLADPSDTLNLFWAGSDLCTDARPSSLDGAYASGLRAAFQAHCCLDSRGQQIPSIDFTNNQYAQWLSGRTSYEVHEEQGPSSSNIPILTISEDDLEL